MYLKESDTDLV